MSGAEWRQEEGALVRDLRLVDAVVAWAFPVVPPRA
jgi:hypothetical protein